MVLRLLPVALLSIFGAAVPAAPAAADWPTFGGANSRAGIVAGAPAFSGFRRRFARSLDGAVYGQPLIAGGRVYVATENNTVYAFSTAGRPLFSRHLGAPVPGGDLPCGNINPSGITGTPVVSGNRVYALAFLRSGHRHVLYGLDAKSGRTLMHVRVDPANPIAQQARGALLADHGRVYVPFGGLDGDCGDYHGYVISVTTAGKGRRSYRNPAAEASIWAPGGISEEPGGSLLVATGNASANTSGFQYDNSVLRLSPTLVRRAFWAPHDFGSLTASDTDIGSISPAPLPQGRVFQSGKDGNGYILGPGLGGIGHELYKAHICDGAFGAPAVAPPYVVVPCSGSLVALRLEGGRFSVAWSDSGNAGSPIVAHGTVIYIQDKSKLRAVALTDGQPRASVDIGSEDTSFPTPGASADLLVAPAGHSIIGFGI